MNIQPISLNFYVKTDALKPKTQTGFRGRTSVPVQTCDVFVKSKTDVLKNIKNIKLKEKINSGNEAEVYKTNFDGYVVRLTRGVKFSSKKLSAVDDPNGLVIASDQYGHIQLMKYIKGEPLYGNGWSVHEAISLNKYKEEFNKIQSLPDETFAEYMREIINIRKNGYDTDPVNPNNFLLNGKHIGIVDLEKSPNIEPELNFNDIDPLVNTYQLRRLLKTMPEKERYKLANNIKTFCDRMITISQKEGYSLSIPNYNKDGFPKDSHLISYLYYQNWNFINKLVRWL